MKDKTFFYLVNMICIYHIVSSASICPAGTEMIPFSNLTSNIRENSIYYIKKEKIMTSPLKINLEIGIIESIHTSLILSESIPIKGFNNPNALVINITPSKEDKEKISLKFKKDLKKKESILMTKKELSR